MVDDRLDVGCLLPAFGRAGEDDVDLLGGVGGALAGVATVRVAEQGVTDVGAAVAPPSYPPVPLR